MRHIVISTHDVLSKYFIEAAALIAGKEAVKDIQYFSMTEGKGVDEFLEDINVYLSSKNKEDEYLIFADLYGASPCNTSLMGFRKKNYRIVTGLNLGILLEAMFLLNEGSLDDVADKLVESGRQGIKKVYLPDK